MSIRLRFTLLYNAILALTLAIFGLALYAIQARTTYDALKNDLERSSDRLAELVSGADANPGGISLPTPDAGGHKPKEFTDDQVFRDLPEREVMRVLDPAGAVLVSPFGRTEDVLPLSSRALESAQAGAAWWETGFFKEQEMLIYTRPVLEDGQVVYILQSARPLTEHDRSLGFLGTTFIAASLLTILIAFGVGWLFSGMILRPINRLTQIAGMIGEERDFTRRVSYSGPQDEVGRLATTFNSMLTRLQDAYQKVAHSLELQRNFVADVSHELRTPLTTLRGNLGLLQHKPSIPLEEQADILSDMTEESDRLIRLVNDLLVLARADAGRSLAQEQVPVLPVLEETCRQARQLEPRRNITLEASPASILGDRDALKQILLIVIDNALKHSEGDVAVSARLSGSQVEILVRDQGPGMAAEKLEHVFDRFYRGEESLTTPGFGLGLPIAKSLVQGMGGQIDIQSEPGQGSLVRIIFAAQ